MAGILLLASGGRLRTKRGRKDSIPSVRSSWPVFYGDTSGRRYSTLTQINDMLNVKSLKLAWAFQTHDAMLKSTPLEVDGILYFTVPDNVWGHRRKNGRTNLGFSTPLERRPSRTTRRGVLQSHGSIFGTPDAHLICLDARNGKKNLDVTEWDVRNQTAVEVSGITERLLQRLP